MSTEEREPIGSQQAPESIEAKAQKLVEKVEKENRFRTKFTANWKTIITVLSVVFVVWSLYSPPFSTLQPMQLRAIHLGFIMTLIWIYYPAREKSVSSNRPGIFDILLILLTVAATVYTVVNCNTLAERGGRALPLDLVFGAIIMILVLEGCRRTLGWTLVILASIFMAYALLGRYIPGVLSHRGTSFSRLIYQMYLTTEGIWGIPLGISATYMVLFVFLTAILGETGGGRLFTDVASKLTGKLTGGPAKVAVVASGFFGMINGSAATNVAGTGTFTIPLMKKTGYEPYFAGAVEAAASTGGQFMPPIMGTVAFLMAEFIGVPYLKIAEAAAIPAIIYFTAVYFAVDARARKLGLHGISDEDMPDWKASVKQYWHMFLPIALLVTMLVKQYSPMLAAFAAVITTLAMSFIKKSTRPTWNGFLKICTDCARANLSIAICMATAGFLIAVLGITGLGVIAGNAIVVLSRGSIILGLFLVMIVTIILGMGLPTSAAYVIAASISVPILTRLGVPLFVAHFFCLYYACISTITPPVALAAYVGAGLAGADPNKVGWTAFRLALPGLLVAFFTAINPALLLIADSPWTIVRAVITALIGCYLFASGSEGWVGGPLPLWSRVGCITAALGLLDPGLLTDIIGAVVGGVSLAIPLMMRRKPTPDATVGG